MTYLNSNQLKQYEDEGFVSPINIFSKEKAKEIRNEIELIEKIMPEELEKSGRYNAHLISPLLDEVTHNSKILDAVESLIGKNILVCGTTLFIKNPYEKGFVSYHQDAKYIGLEPHNWVTAWVAITDSNEKNGCMRMWSGSHKDDLKDHNQMFNEGNLLTRGQTVNNVPKEIPTMMQYNTHINKESMFNTPPVMSIYAVNRSLNWLDSIGGVPEMEIKNRAKAKKLYEEIERNSLFRCPVNQDDRSMMNIPFVFNDNLDELHFLEFCKDRGLFTLKGHRSVGGFRASIYNAMPEAGVDALVQAMKDYESK